MKVRMTQQRNRWRQWHIRAWGAEWADQPAPGCRSLPIWNWMGKGRVGEGGGQGCFSSRVLFTFSINRIRTLTLARTFINLYSSIDNEGFGQFVLAWIWAKHFCDFVGLTVDVVSWPTFILETDILILSSNFTDSETSLMPIYIHVIYSGSVLGHY